MTAALTPANLYHGPSGRLDGPEETRWAVELRELRGRHADG